MSIEKRAGWFFPICDWCGEELHAEDDFYAAVEAKKDDGWRSKKEHGEWFDICPECQKREIVEEFK